ncbi:putative solute carrier family member [Colletotrichum tanaceti]|uniref:Putative solute carrier family member n=1 Tax=Colletotrichum tanaceti TaxID=1306861 RepID=A0A4V6DF81_9PEZI|nr:putative solute carrier family member [Colletotrichum tanaceti]TKW48176.1 putative solute carrier family member [Colletotrichum tanaceti]
MPGNSSRLETIPSLPLLRLPFARRIAQTGAPTDTDPRRQRHAYEPLPTMDDTAKNLYAAPVTTTQITAGPDESELVTQGLHDIEARKVHWWSYFTTLDFWIILLIGQILALCITSTNTFTSFLANNGVSIPAFQTVFNYILLFLIYFPVTIWKYGFKKWAGIVVRDGWKYFILSFLDVQGNYVTVLAYRYTNILSAQLLNFWAIVVVIVLSFFLLRVRYKIFQIVGILVAIGGCGVLLASDHITGSNGGPGVDLVKGDLLALLGATLYGVTNVAEEWFVSRRPVYEVLSFMGMWGMCINGVQVAIFDRDSFRQATWNGPAIGYLLGYTFALCLFYSLVPLLLRMASAAFYNISLLTGNFWGIIIGVNVFGYAVHWMYPIAFVLIILGQVAYFLAGSMLGDSKKPWLGDNQENGVAGLGTAKLKAINAARKRQMGTAGVSGILERRTSAESAV